MNRKDRYRNKKRTILTWPEDGFLSKFFYVLFYPFYLIYYIIMPNILYNPEIIKVLIGIIFTFLFFLLYAFLLTRIQEDLVLNFKIKPQLIGLFNSIFYSLSFAIYCNNFARTNGSSEEVNIFLTIQELSIYKFTFLVSCIGIFYWVSSGQLLDSPKLNTMIFLSFCLVMFLMVLSVLVHVTGLWKKRGCKWLIGAGYCLFFGVFVAINVYF